MEQSIKPSSFISLDISEEFTQEITSKSNLDKSLSISNILSNSNIISNIESNLSDCLYNDISYDEKNDIYTYICLDYSKENIINNIKDIVKKIDSEKNDKLIGKDFIAQVIHMDYLDENITKNNTKIFDSSSSYTNFTECEIILRDFYNISSPRKIIFIQIELNNTNNDILINQLEYQAYSDEKELLNLSLCENANIKTYYNIKNDKKEEVDLISLFKEKNIDILDINDNFYNDVCLPYSDSEKDLTLNDRIKDIYKNYQLCEKNCKLTDINVEEYKAICDCTIKQDMNVKDLNFEFSNDKNEKKYNNNFKIIKCHNSFTSIKDNLRNIGFMIFLGLMILNIIFLILYFCGIKSISNYIGKEMANNGYLGKSDINHMFCHNYINRLNKLIDRLKNIKNNYIKNRGYEPPKKKTKNIKVSEIGNIINEKRKSKNNQKDILKNKINLIKSRMEKTKKIKENISNTNDRFFGNSLNTNVPNFNKKNEFQLNLININVNDNIKQIYTPKLSECILNNYNFQEAIKYDKRSICRIYYIFLIAKQVIMHAFFYKSPLEPLYIRLSLLKFMLGCDLALNAIFYIDDKVSENYNSSKSLIKFALTNNLIIILLSTLIGYILFIFLAIINNSTNEIRNLFRTEEEKIKKNKKYKISLERKKEIICEVKRILKNYKIKIIIFYIIEFLFMIFFWYYVTIFCNIYKKTQLSWLIDCLITIIIRVIIDFFINMILSLLYKFSLSLNSKCIFRIVIFFYCFS